MTRPRFGKTLALKTLLESRAVFYKVRYWSASQNKWVFSESEFTNKKMAMSHKKDHYFDWEKPTVVAFLLNGQRVFINGTRR